MEADTLSFVLLDIKCNCAYNLYHTKSGKTSYVTELNGGTRKQTDTNPYFQSQLPNLRIEAMQSTNFSFSLVL